MLKLYKHYGNVHFLEIIYNCLKKLISKQLYRVIYIIIYEIRML